MSQASVWIAPHGRKEDEMKLVIRRFGVEVFTDEQNDDGQYLVESRGKETRYENDVEIELRGTWTPQPEDSKPKVAAKSTAKAAK